MDKKTMAIGLLLVIALFTGCTTVGTPTSQIAASKTSQIIVGQSTMADVRAIMGEPIAVYRSFRGEQFWEYHYTPELSTAGKVASCGCYPFSGMIGAIITAPGSTACYISFDDKGIVKSVECK
jgi:hypothetical protein